MKAVYQENKEAKKARREDKKCEKLDRYKELKEKISGANAKQKFPLNNVLLNLLWFGLLTENPNSKQAMKESEKFRNPRNRAVLPTQDILNLIKEYDGRVFFQPYYYCMYLEKTRKWR